jgi:hypothetical protein
MMRADFTAHSHFHRRWGGSFRQAGVFVRSGVPSKDPYMGESHQAAWRAEKKRITISRSHFPETFGREIDRLTHIPLRPMPILPNR